jgi:NADPH2:quinone reductase
MATAQQRPVALSRVTGQNGDPCQPGTAMTDLPATMTAIAITAPGGPDVLKPQTRPVPVPGPGEILIRVAAAGVNRPDVLQRAGLYPPPPDASDLPGLEAAGIVAATGPGVTRWRVGDSVTALLGGGGYAPYVATPEAHALPVPPGLSMVEAAGLPETAFTVWHNVFERGGLKAGEWLLVHGGTSGIGTLAIQLAKARGARVIATAGSDDKCAACRQIGADVAINYRTQDFVAEAKAATGGTGADVILDMVGGTYVARNYDAAASDGRIVQIAVLAGPKAEVDVRRLMLKRLTHTGSTLRARTRDVKAAIAAAVEREVWPLVAAGQVRPLIHATFPLEQAADAHTLMESSTHVGKIMLTL